MRFLLQAIETIGLLQPKPFCFLFFLALSDSVSSCVTLSFQWISGHVGLPSNEPAGPVIAKISHIRYANWRRKFFRNYYFCQIPSVSSEELTLPRLAYCELSRHHCYSHIFLLSSYLCRIKQKENSSYSTCGNHLQDLTRLFLECPVSEPLQRANFCSTSSIFDLWSWPWGVTRLLGLLGILPRLHLSEGIG